MMDRDTFSHIGLWCPRPFGSYSQNKGGNLGSKPSSKGSNEVDPSSLCKVEHSSGRVNVEEQEEKEVKENVGFENTPPPTELDTGFLMQTNASAPPVSSPLPNSSEPQMEDGRVLLDTWYVIKPGNTKEKIAFFVAHQFSGANQPRPSAVKVKGNWATDCSKAKRRRRCSTNDTPTHAHASKPHLSHNSCNAPSSCDQSPSQRGKQTDLLSVAEMIALVEQRTAMALQGIVAAQRNQLDHKSSTNQNQGLSPNQHTLFHGTGLDPASMLAAPESSNSDASIESWDLTDKEIEGQQESCRVAKAIAHFEAQNMENQLNLDVSSVDSVGQDTDREMGTVRESGPVTTSPTSEGHDEVRIAFRVSNLDTRSHLESASRSRCVFMSCGSGANYAPARAKEKITCDLYQLLTPSFRDSNLLLAASTSASKLDEEQSHVNRTGCGSPERMQELPSGEKKADGVRRDLVTGFHVEVVVTGAVDQCVFYGKDSKEKVQGKTVCFVMPNGGGSGNGVETSNEHLSDDPLPGQLFLLQPPRGAEADAKVMDHGSGSGLCSLDCVNKTGPVVMTVSSGERSTQPNSASFVEDCSDPSLCRLYRHVSHDFLEIRFQIQQLLEPRQYMLLLPDHIMVNIFSYLPTHSLAALKCTCHYFKMLIETYGVRAVDSRWNQDPLYRDDPCKQCKRQYECGDVSLCRWHPKPYHHDLPYGRSYWMCCRRTDKDTPGCRIGLHDNNWVQQRVDGSESICTKREDRREEAR